MAVEMAGARQAVFEAAMEAATVVEIAVEMAGVARAAATFPALERPPLRGLWLDAGS